VPLGSWFRGRLGGFARELLLPTGGARQEMFDRGYVTQLLDMHERGRDLNLQLWTLISFELWCRRFLDVPPARQDMDMPLPLPAKGQYMGFAAQP
jgi:asparagine synthase (glutamine-hydrolysing)